MIRPRDQGSRSQTPIETGAAGDFAGFGTPAAEAAALRPLRDGCYDISFRTRLGESHCAARLRDGQLRGGNHRLEINGSLHDLGLGGLRALVAVRILEVPLAGSSVFGSADHVQLVLHGARTPLGLTFTGPLPGQPEAEIDLRLRRVRPPSGSMRRGCSSLHERPERASLETDA